MRLRRLALCLASTGIFVAASAATARGELRVIVTIKPLHSLVAQVMMGVAVPAVLVPGTTSPHTYALKPSDAGQLARAHVFFRMSPAMEPFTERLAAALPPSVQVVTLQDGPGLRLLSRRSGTTFLAATDRASSDPEGVVDAHAWLDPGNAEAMADNVADVLAARDPEHATIFKANAAALKIRLKALSKEIELSLAEIVDKPFIVFHDAFQYFERRYGLSVVGSIFLNPDVPIGAKRLADLRHAIVARGVSCVFMEPNLHPGPAQALAEGTHVRIGTLDPEALTFVPGPDLYFQLMRRLAGDLKACLAPVGGEKSAMKKAAAEK